MIAKYDVFIMVLRATFVLTVLTPNEFYKGQYLLITDIY